MKLFKNKQSSNENDFENFPAIDGLLISKMVVDQNIKPHFILMIKVILIGQLKLGKT